MAAGAPPPSTKVDLVHLLAASRGYRHYLEICTPTTGTTYSSVDQSRFATSMRLMYRCPSDFEDGAPIDFRVPDDDVTPALAEMQRAGARFDVALVDSWHEYAPSWRDIVEVYARMMSGGAMVVARLPAARPHHGVPVSSRRRMVRAQLQGLPRFRRRSHGPALLHRRHRLRLRRDLEAAGTAVSGPNGRAPSGSESAVGASPPPRRPTALGDDWRAASSDLERAFDVFEARPAGSAAGWSTPRASAPSSTSSSGRPIAG
jgi:hypothetical protein